MRSRTFTAVVIAALAGVTVACAIGSPMVLALADRWWRPNWGHLADIGQAYGAVSAVFSGLAVGGVAVTLFYQGRQLRLARVQAVRGSHRELLLRAMDNPAAYASAAGFHRWRESDMKPEQLLYLTSYFGYLQAAFDTGVADEVFLRSEGFADVFSGELGRRWWAAAGPNWRLMTDPVTKRFVRIADEVYQRSVAAGPPIEASIFDSTAAAVTPSSPAPSVSVRPVVLAAVVAAAAVAGWLIGRNR